MVFFLFSQPHGEQVARARPRSNTNRSAQEEDVKHDSSKQESDEELPLARVRENAHAAKVLHEHDLTSGSSIFFRATETGKERVVAFFQIFFI